MVCGHDVVFIVQDGGAFDPVEAVAEPSEVGGVAPDLLGEGAGDAERLEVELGRDVRLGGGVGHCVASCWCAYGVPGGTATL
jgi:hypothetical protein